MINDDYQVIEEETSHMGKGKRVRRQVQYFQPGADAESAFQEDDNDYDDSAQNQGSDNEYQGVLN